MASIISFQTGILNVFVSAFGELIEKGTEVDIYIVEENRDIFVKVSSAETAVKLPFYGTDIDWLLGKTV